jgi:hypothetical protein
MTSPVPLPIGSYTALDPRASGKRLVGCMPEMTDQDNPSDTKSQYNPAFLRRFAGIRSVVSDGSNFPVRGFWEMQGVEYCVIGPNLYAMSTDPITQVATLTQLNGSTPITGNSFVRMADNTQCLVLLQPGTTNAWTYCPGAGTQFAALSWSGLTALGALDIWYIDSYIVFLGTDGRTFFNDSGQASSGVNQITFTGLSAGTFTREFGTDLFVGGASDHREIMLFGARTTEGYVNAGNPAGTPFSSAADSFMEIGAHPLCGYTIAKQDQSILWVANDLTVRRRNGQTPTRISNSGIEQILQQIASPNGNQGTLLGAYALTPTVCGHPLWVLQLPFAISPEGTKGRTLVYDCLTQHWFELASYTPAGVPLGMWRILCYHNGIGGQLVGDALTSTVGILDTTIFSEFGGPMICEWTFQSLYNGHNRFTLRRIEVVVTPGQGTSLTTAPTVDLYLSRDGLVYDCANDPQSLGLPGETDHRVVWWNKGQWRDCFIRNRITDPAETFTVDAEADIQPGYY